MCRYSLTQKYSCSIQELLTILADCKSVRKLVPHIKKCFTFTKIGFSEKDEITDMISAENETVKLSENVETALNPGAVEIWFSALEKVMRDSVLKIMYEGEFLSFFLQSSVNQVGVEDHATKPRLEWVQLHSGQVILTVNQIVWTWNVTEAIQKGPKGLKEFSKQSNQELQDVVKMVRGKLQKKLRKLLGLFPFPNIHPYFPTFRCNDRS